MKWFSVLGVVIKRLHSSYEKKAVKEKNFFPPL